jgi:hypothetical protein
VDEVKPVDPSSNVAEVQRLGLVEGVSVRRIARHLDMSRWAVREILGWHDAPWGPRLDLDEGNILRVDDTSGRDEAR